MSINHKENPKKLKKNPNINKNYNSLQLKPYQSFSDYK